MASPKHRLIGSGLTLCDPSGNCSRELANRVLLEHSWLVHADTIKLVAAALLEEVECDWGEVRRLAESNAYKNWNHVRELVHEKAEALQVRNPCDSNE